MYRSFVSLGRYTPKYFILFLAMVNGIVSLSSLSVFSLLVYRSARDFCVLILCPATNLQCGTITCQSGWLLSKSLQAINAEQAVEKREPSYTVGGNAT